MGAKCTVPARALLADPPAGALPAGRQADLAGVGMAPAPAALAARPRPGSRGAGAGDADHVSGREARELRRDKGRAAAGAAAVAAGKSGWAQGFGLGSLFWSRIYACSCKGKANFFPPPFLSFLKAIFFF